jgi:hypothetical protein
MGAVPEMVVCGLTAIGSGAAVLLALAVRRRQQPAGHHVGSAHRRRGPGSWEYQRPADTEPDVEFVRGLIRDNLRPGERP